MPRPGSRRPGAAGTALRIDGAVVSGARVVQAGPRDDTRHMAAFEISNGDQNTIVERVVAICAFTDAT